MDTTVIDVRPDHLVGRAVHLRLGDFAEVTIANVRTDWFRYFMSHLGSIGYTGKIDWTYEWTEGHHCVALWDLSHADNAIHFVTSVALDYTFARHNDGWAYSWYDLTSEHPSDTMLKGAYLTDIEVTVGNTPKRGWRFVMPLLNTDNIAGRRHGLPTHATSYDDAPREQVG